MGDHDKITLAEPAPRGRLTVPPDALEEVVCRALDLRPSEARILIEAGRFRSTFRGKTHEVEDELGLDWIAKAVGHSVAARTRDGLLLAIAQLIGGIGVVDRAGVGAGESPATSTPEALVVNTTDRPLFDRPRRVWVQPDGEVETGRWVHLTDDELAFLDFRRRHVAAGGMTPENEDKIGTLALAHHARVNATFPFGEREILLAMSFLLGILGVMRRAGPKGGAK